MIIPLGIFLFSLALNWLTALAGGFDGLYGQDAYSYFAHAGELYTRLSLFHHWQWEAEPRILYWPVGFSGQIALLFLLTGLSTVPAQLLCLVSWAGAAGLTASIGIKLFGSQWAGLVAGGLVALSPLGRQVAVSIMSDAPALFWTMLAVWLALKVWKQDNRGWWLVLAGLALGIAGITRYSALTAAPLLAIIWYWSGAKAQLRFRWLALAGLALGLVYLPQFIINQVYPEYFWNVSWLADWSIVNPFRASFETRDGFQAYTLPPLVFYLGYTLLNPHFLTPALLPLVGLGGLALWQRRAGAEALLLVSWWLIPIVVLSGIPYESERYSLTFLPPLALAAGLGVSWALESPWLTKLKAGRWAGLGLLGLGLVGLGVLSQRHVNGFMAVKQADLGIVRQVEAKLPAQATLITFSLSLTFDHYTPQLAVRDLFFLDPATIQELVQAQPEVYLLADPENMAKQWSGNHTGVAFEAARQQIKGEPLAHFGPYWLWKLGR